jgi:hypothetical protein
MATPARDSVPLSGSAHVVTAATEASPDSSLCSRYFTIGQSFAGISISFVPTRELTLGSARRAEEARRCVVNLLKRRRAKALIEGSTVHATIPSHAIAGLRALVSELDAALDAFREERLHPRVVEEILGITARERRDWTKDGRLPTSGSGAFQGGRQTIHFPLYPTAKIAALARVPGMLESLAPGG